ncbi:protein TolQ [Dasania sp. GY-MA-18]|uniref:Tol-Pal system protein TolQ n=1 Tax=Dasania phycosphaerae TaxID=2950436 RepID=A0A9J6RGV2_9GAMM|nr:MULTISPECIES: protein TolQ [Dasania]MCR8921142.1 protein TolQ [Dasania sp. GY-MA-18]MCZ0863570.1 protein TolQ [Dasania phycosphaerae]MCZ0867298.1 protein TolQ [Dasania phycosphaerae]
MAEELSVIDLILNASITVQLVMLTLFLASVISWFMIVQRMFYFRATDTAMRVFEQQFWSGIDLSQLFRKGTANTEAGKATVGMENIFRAGFKEFTRLRQQGHIDPDAIIEGAQRAMRVALSREEEQMEKHLAFLATVGSTSPYVGLFGTVWGIMGAFQGLAMMHQATLATVAPGISEALVATAMGLFAAIPAVVGFNRFSARFESLMNKYETFSDEFISILHRQTHSSAAKG